MTMPKQGQTEQAAAAVVLGRLPTDDLIRLRNYAFADWDPRDLPGFDVAACLFPGRGADGVPRANAQAKRAFDQAVSERLGR